LATIAIPLKALGLFHIGQEVPELVPAAADELRLMAGRDERKV
jgi:hypothetical protein